MPTRLQRALNRIGLCAADDKEQELRELLRNVINAEREIIGDDRTAMLAVEEVLSDDKDCWQE
jgi:hypothetical protein